MHTEFHFKKWSSKCSSFIKCFMNCLSLLYIIFGRFIIFIVPCFFNFLKGSSFHCLPHSCSCIAFYNGEQRYGEMTREISFTRRHYLLCGRQKLGCCTNFFAFLFSDFSTPLSVGEFRSTGCAFCCCFGAFAAGLFEVCWTTVIEKGRNWMELISHRFFCLYMYISSFLLTFFLAKCIFLAVQSLVF